MDLSDAASLPPRLASATCPPMAATETSARQPPAARAPPRPSGPGGGVRVWNLWDSWWNMRKTIGKWWLSGIYNISDWWLRKKPSEKYELVNWDGDIPNIQTNKIHVPNDQLIIWFLKEQRTMINVICYQLKSRGCPNIYHGIYDD